MSVGIPYSRIELNKMEQLKREMKQMHAKHPQEPEQMRYQLDTFTEGQDEVDPTITRQ